LLTAKFSYKENTVCNCYGNIEHSLFCIRPFALHRQQPEKDKQNVAFASPWKNFCGRPCSPLLKSAIFSLVHAHFKNRPNCYSNHHTDKPHHLPSQS